MFSKPPQKSLHRPKVVLKKNSPTLPKNLPNFEDFEYEIPKFIDLKNLPSKSGKDPFDNELVDRDLDDLWFTFEHYYHEHSPEKTRTSTLSNKHQKSNKKMAEASENNETFDVLDYIQRKKNYKEKSLSANKRKSLYNGKNEGKSGKEEDLNVNLGLDANKKENMPNLKRKVEPIIFKKGVTGKKFITQGDLDKKQKFFNISTSTNCNNKNNGKITNKNLHKNSQNDKNNKNSQIDENSQNDKKNQNDKNSQKNKNFSNSINEKNSQNNEKMEKNQKLFKNESKSIFDHNHFNTKARSTKPVNPKSVGHSFIQNESFNMSMNLNNANLTVSYVPAMHSTREIRRWEKNSGKEWYKLNTKERLTAIGDINKMLQDEKNVKN